MSGRWNRGLGALAAVIAVLALAACGSSSSNNSSGSAGSGSSASGSKFTGAPLNIALLAQLTGANGAYDPWNNAAIAAINAVNAKGGVNGHKLVAKVCDLGTSANTAQACGRQAVAEHAVGAVLNTVAPENVEPFLRQAQIPTFDYLCTPVMLTSPISYSVTAPCPATVTGLAALGKRIGCHKMSLIRAIAGESPADSKAFGEGFLSDAKRLGLPASYVLGQAGAADMSPFVAKALSGGTDCLFLTGFGNDIIAEIKAAAQADPSGKVKIMLSPSLITPAGAKSLGNTINRVIGTTFTWQPSDAAKHPGVQQFINEIHKYAPTPNDLTSNSMDRWAATHAIIAAIKDVQGEVTAPKVKAAFDKMSHYDPGIGPPVNFTKPNPVKTAPRVFAPYAIETKFVNGKLFSVGNFFNIYTGAAAPQ